MLTARRYSRRAESARDGERESSCAQPLAVFGSWHDESMGPWEGTVLAACAGRAVRCWRHLRTLLQCGSSSLSRALARLRELRWLPPGGFTVDQRRFRELRRRGVRLLHAPSDARAGRRENRLAVARIRAREEALGGLSVRWLAEDLRITQRAARRRCRRGERAGIVRRVPGRWSVWSTARERSRSVPVSPRPRVPQPSVKVPEPRSPSEPRRPRDPPNRSPKLQDVRSLIGRLADAKHTELGTVRRRNRTAADLLAAFDRFDRAARTVTTEDIGSAVAFVTGAFASIGVVGNHVQTRWWGHLLFIGCVARADWTRRVRTLLAVPGLRDPAGYVVASLFGDLKKRLQLSARAIPSAADSKRSAQRSTT